MVSSLNQSQNARTPSQQQVVAKRFEVNFNDANIASGTRQVAVLPAGAIPIGSDVMLVTAFNAVTTNVLTVGMNTPTSDNLIGAADVDEATPGLTLNIKPSGVAGTTVQTADTPIYVKYTQTGTAATAGKAHIIIRYVMQEPTLS